MGYLTEYAQNETKLSVRQKITAQTSTVRLHPPTSSLAWNALNLDS